MSVDKTQFALDPRGRPKRTVKIGGRIVTEEVYAPGSGDEGEAIDELMVGITRRDLESGLSHFGRMYPDAATTAAAGSGPIDARPKRHYSYDNENSYNTAADSLEDEIENPADYDLFDLPDTHPKPDYIDRVEAAGKSSDNIDQDDIWSMELFEDFTENRHSGPADEPTFTGKPHRQREASKDSLFDLLDDVFGT